jgi:hypothetical protein
LDEQTGLRALARLRRSFTPGSEQIPPLQAFLALLLPKLLGHRRISHISDLCADEGAGLWAGLNVLPKTTSDFTVLNIMVKRTLAVASARKSRD